MTDDEGKVPQNFKINARVSNALRDAKNAQRDAGNKPDNKASIGREALEEWLDAHADQDRPAYDEISGKGRKDLNIPLAVDLEERLTKEAERRERANLEPTSKRRIVEAAILMWLRANGYESLADQLSSES